MGLYHYRSVSFPLLINRPSYVSKGNCESDVCSLEYHNQLRMKLTLWCNGGRERRTRTLMTWIQFSSFFFTYPSSYLRPPFTQTQVRPSCTPINRPFEAPLAAPRNGETEPVINMSGRRRLAAEGLATSASPEVVALSWARPHSSLSPDGDVSTRY